MEVYILNVSQTNTNPNLTLTDTGGANARIQKFIHYMAIAAICDSGPLVR